MPKVIVVVLGGEELNATAAAVVAGAKTVRFTEVELRSDEKSTAGADSHGSHVVECDGVVIVCGPNDGSPASASASDRLLDDWEKRPAAEMRDVVFGVLGGDDVLRRVARLGGIVMTQPSKSDDVEDGRALGARVAKVAGWVRHALGHEAEHAAKHAAEHAKRQHDLTGHSH